MRRLLPLLLMVPLFACGVDGDPVPPPAKAKPGVTLTGEASIGIVSQ
ncbi:MAG: argininosuccinate lyase [Rhodobacteraceae bacterium PARR1]|nr:MAG: argininosuccinate lyase [Rhodobacteraceae bacterium PARR1]